MPGEGLLRRLSPARRAGAASGAAGGGGGAAATSSQSVPSGPVTSSRTSVRPRRRSADSAAISATSGWLFCRDRWASTTTRHASPRSRDEIARRLRVGQVPVAAQDPLLERPRIRPVSQHVGVVVRLDQHGVAAAERVDEPAADVAEVRGMAERLAVARDHEGQRRGRVVRHGHALDGQAADLPRRRPAPARHSPRSPPRPGRPRRTSRSSRTAARPTSSRSRRPLANGPGARGRRRRPRWNRRPRRSR